MSLPKDWKMEIVDTGGGKMEVVVTYKQESVKGEIAVQKFINSTCKERSEKLATFTEYAMYVKRLKNITHELSLVMGPKVSSNSTSFVPAPTVRKEGSQVLPARPTPTTTHTPEEVVQSSRPNAALKKGMLVCRHCKYPVTTNRVKLGEHEAQCVTFIGDKTQLSKSTETVLPSQSRKRNIAEITRPRPPHETEIKVKWKMGIVREIISSDEVIIELSSSQGQKVGLTKYNCSIVRPKRAPGWAYEEDSAMLSPGKTPSSQYKIGQKVEVQLKEIVSSSRNKKKVADITESSSAEVESEMSCASNILPSKSKGSTGKIAKDNADKSLEWNAGSVATVASHVLDDSIGDNKPASAIAVSKIKRVVGGRLTGAPVVGSLPSLEYLQTYVAGRDGFQNSTYKIMIKKIQTDLLRKYDHELFMDWLMQLQCDRNLLCFGAGCKKQLMCNFAKEMLYDEDVIEVNFNCGKNLALLDTLSCSIREGTCTQGNIDLGAGPSRASSSKGHGHVNVLWNLLRAIRVNVLRMAPTDHGVSEEWFYPNEHAPSPIVHEARTVAELLKTHYGWWKSTAGRAARGRCGFTGDVFFSSSREGLDLERTNGEEDISGSDDEGVMDVMKIVTEVDEPTGVDDDVSSCVSTKVDQHEESNLTENSPVENSSRGLLSRTSSRRRSVGPDGNAELGGKVNAAYSNSISRLYIIVHNIEEAFGYSSGHGRYPSETFLDVQQALSVLAECPVISIVASMTSVNGPLHLGWDTRMLSSFQWKYYHTPTFVDHDILPELLKICATAATRSGTESGRGAKALKYILRSLTKKHCDVLKYLLKAQENVSSKENGVSTDNDGDGGVKGTNDIEGGSVGKSHGVKWTVLLSQCINQFIVKTDSELRQLIGELKDQRIVRTHSDSDGVLHVSLILSPLEVRSALEYFSSKKMTSS